MFFKKEVWSIFSSVSLSIFVMTVASHEFFTKLGISGWIMDSGLPWQVWVVTFVSAAYIYFRQMIRVARRSGKIGISSRGSRGFGRVVESHVRDEDGEIEMTVDLGDVHGFDIVFSNEGGSDEERG